VHNQQPRSQSRTKITQQAAAAAAAAGQDNPPSPTMDASNEPLDLCTKGAPLEPQQHQQHQRTVDYDEACLPERKLNGGASPTPDESDVDALPFNPNLLLQQQHQLEQYLLMQQQQQAQQHMLDGTQAKAHLDKYLKLTNRYLSTMSPFLQHFSPLGGNAQAAANAAATLLLANHHVDEPSEDRKSPDSCDGSALASHQDGVRLFLHKLIEYNFLQQLQQQQQINDLINNNNNNNNNHSSNKNGSGSIQNGHNHGKAASKSPSPSVDGDGEFYGAHPMLNTPTSAKTFFDFLKSASAASSGQQQGGASGGGGGGGSSNGHNSRIQNFKRFARPPENNDENLTISILFFSSNPCLNFLKSILAIFLINTQFFYSVIILGRHRRTAKTHLVQYHRRI
jgi:hypothetical protein